MRATPGRSYPNHARRLVARRMHFACAGRVRKGRRSGTVGSFYEEGKVAADQGFRQRPFFQGSNMLHDTYAHLVSKIVLLSRCFH